MSVAGRRLRLGPLWWTGGILLGLLVVLGSLQPPGDLLSEFISDKLAHFVGYGVLSFWFAGLLERGRYPMLALLLVAFGVAIEGMQHIMGYGRSADWRDVVANSLGIATALLLAYAGLGAWMLFVERRLGLS